MQEVEQEIGRQVVVIVKDVVKLTPRALAKALSYAAKIAKAPAEHRRKKAIKKEQKQTARMQRHGRMTVKELAEKDKGMTPIELHDSGFRDFSRIARKYGIDFAVKKVKLICVFLIVSMLTTLLLPVSAASGGDAAATGFSDVPATKWYAAAVTYAASSGFAVGSGGQFRPCDAVTRGEFVTMLARVLVPDGIPDDIPASQFEDVPSDKFYARPVAWAIANGITSGTSETTFSPSDNVQRQDMAVMLFRAELLPILGNLPLINAPIEFLDADLISDYAKAAVALLQQQGLMAGDGAGYVNPRGALTRAEAAAVLSSVQMIISGHVHDFQPAETITASCTTKEVQIYRCTCGSCFGKKVGSALGHDYTAQSDTSSWTVTYTCTRCGDSYTEPLPGMEPQKIFGGNILLSHDQILSYIDRLQQIYPNLISSYVGGYSVWGTEIRVVTLGKGSRYIYMNGNIHSKETITTNYLLKVLDEYAYAYATNGKIGSYSIKPLLDTFTIVMIPCSNPDGRAKVLSGNQCKTNGHGVNLNENFPTKWKYASSGVNGAYAGSEPETQAILGVLNRYPFELVLDCHTSGNVIYYADYDCSSSLRTKSYNLANAMKAESSFGLYYYSASAGLANYARHPMGIPGFTVEMYPYTTGAIDCTKLTSWVWPKLATMPAIAMTFLR